MKTEMVLTAGEVGHKSGYLVYDFQIGRVEGKLLTLIETLGLHESQEKATKDLTRDIVQSLYRDTQYLYGQAVYAALEKQDELKASGVGENLPPNYTPAFS